MRRAAKADLNQPDIVDALRQMGASVVHLHTVGQGCPDLLVGFRGRTQLVEVKGERGTLTQPQREWHQAWRGSPVVILRSVADAVALVGHIANAGPLACTSHLMPSGETILLKT